MSARFVPRHRVMKARPELRATLAPKVDIGVQAPSINMNWVIQNLLA